MSADGEDTTTLTLEVRDADDVGIDDLTEGDFTFNNTGNALSANFINVENGTYTIDFTNETVEDLEIQVSADGIDIGTTGTIRIVED